MKTQHIRESMGNYFYLARRERGKWCISNPALFATKTQTGMELRAIRDTQFSFIAKGGSSMNIVLFKTKMMPYELLKYLGSKRQDFLDLAELRKELDGDDSVQIAKLFKYHVNPFETDQSGLSMTYHRVRDLPPGTRFSEDDCEDVKFYLYWPVIHLDLVDLQGLNLVDQDGGSI